MAMCIYVFDGLRHASLTGYGELSRQIIFGLLERGHEIVLQNGPRTWGAIEGSALGRLEALPTRAGPGQADIVLQIGTPGSCRPFSAPSLLYTQNALSDLRDDWIEAIRRADGCIVPGEFDRRVFSRYVERAYVARQSSDHRRFRPVPQWREEGSRRYTFLFVGSYGFRKGVDLLLEAFLQEFHDSEPVELILHCAGVGRGGEFNHLLRSVQRVRPQANVSLFGHSMSPAWMCRIYNRCDCVVTLSRGEGWCMPITEALLCERAVIAPDSTAMGEYLDNEIAYLVPTAETLVTDVDSPFGAGFRKAYGKPGLAFYEPSVGTARSHMRRVFENQDAAACKAKKGRQRITESVTWSHTARQIEAACSDLLIHPVP